MFFIKLVFNSPMWIICNFIITILEYFTMDVIRSQDSNSKYLYRPNYNGKTLSA